MRKISKLNFYYSGVDCRYHTTYNCEGHGCRDEGICRCGVIVDAKITTVDYQQVCELLREFAWKDGCDEQISNYGVDRIARHFKCYDLTSYEVSVVNSYYGEEIEAIHHKEENSLKLTLNDFVASSNPVEFLLNLEYFQVLPDCLNREWKVVEVDYDNIVAGSGGQLQMVKRTSNPYEYYHGILGVCLPIGNKYRLIDGYHRYVAMQNQQKVKIIVAD